jgi:hypothetical protein
MAVKRKGGEADPNPVQAILQWWTFVMVSCHSTESNMACFTITPGFAIRITISKNFYK